MVTSTRALLALMVFGTFVPSLVFGQGTKAGVVTTLEGNVSVARTPVATPLPLKSKDDVFLQDRVTAGDQSFARLLLGGKAVVNIRERSTLTITEIPGRTTIDMESGKIALTVAREKMRPGESIEIRSPNAIAGVRGTVVVAEVLLAGAPGGAQSAVTSRFHVLLGQVELLQFDPGTRAQVASATLGQLQSFSAQGRTPGTVTPIAPSQVSGIVSGLSPRSLPQESGGQDAAKVQQVESFVSLMGAIGGPGAGPVVRTLPLPLPPPVPVEPPILPGNKDPRLAEPPPPPPPPPPPTVTPPIFIPPSGQAITGLACDDCVLPNVALGFSFPFRGRTFTTVDVSSNGVLSLGGNDGSLCCDASSSVFLRGFPKIAPLWFDLLPAVSEGFGGGAVRFDGTATRAVFTWDHVFEFDRQSNNTFQVQLNANGQIVFSYQSVDIAEHTALVGVTSAGNSADPGSRRLTKGLAFTTGPDGTVYQLFINSLSPDPDLSLLVGKSIVFTPSTTTSGAFDVLVDAIQSFFLVDSRDLALDWRDPLLTLERTAVHSPGYYFEQAGGSTVSLHGPLLAAFDSPLTFEKGLVGIAAGSHLVVNSSDPLVSITGGIHAIATLPGSAMFDFAGGPTAIDRETGLQLGSDAPLTHGGPLLQTSGAEVNGQSVLKVDTALLEATAPIIRLLEGSRLTSAGHAIDLVRQANVSIAGDAMAMVSLDRSSLTVANGHLVNVAGGSRLSIAGALLSLANGSTATMLNGLVLNASGNSVVDIRGDLVRFTGTGNVLTVNNAIRPTALLAGIPVSGPASGVAITNLAALSGLGTAGTISVNGVALTPSTPLSALTGSLIAVQPGSSVRIGR